MFLLNINVRLSGSRAYMVLRRYVYISFKKHNSNKSFMIEVYFFMFPYYPTFRLFGDVDFPHIRSKFYCIITTLVRKNEIHGYWGRYPA